MSGSGPDVFLEALLAIARHFGRALDPDDVRQKALAGRDPLRLEGFLLAARRLGFRTQREPVEAEALLEVPLPALLTLFGRAPLLLVARQGESFLALEPARGTTRRTSLEELVETAEEIVVLQPVLEPEAQRDWKRLLRRRVSQAVRELLLASLFINLFVLAPPIFLLLVFNRVIARDALDTLNVLLVGMAAVYLFDVVLRGLRGYVAAHTAARLEAIIGGELVHRLLRLPYRRFEATSVGLVNEQLRQLEIIRLFFTSEVPLGLVDLAFVLLLLLLLFAISASLAAVVAATLPLFVTVSALLHRTQRRLVEESFVTQAAKTTALAEAVNNVLTVKSLGLEAEIERRWGQRLGLAAATGVRSANLANLLSTLGYGLQQLVLLLVVYLGARQVMAGELSIGGLIAANLLAYRIMDPARRLVATWRQLQEVRAAFRRLDRLMAEAPAGAAAAVTPVPPLSGRIDLEGVSVTLAAGRPPILDKVDLSVRPGTILGVVGPAGAGKTTLVRLLEGLYEPSEGAVLLDGTDIRHIPLAQIRREIAVVPQEVQLFAGTIHDNIAIGLPGSEAEPRRVVAAAKFVGAHGFIQRLPQGYGTFISESGAGLSAGQRQLIAIARAVIRNPRILILDEATSALDGESELILMRNLKRVSASRTIIIVTHRPALLSIATRVVRVTNGTLAPLAAETLLVGTSSGGEAGGETLRRGLRHHG